MCRLLLDRNDQSFIQRLFPHICISLTITATTKIMLLFLHQNYKWTCAYAMENGKNYQVKLLIKKKSLAFIFAGLCTED